MSARETVCLTFAGNPAVDSRCLKMAVTLSEDYSVHIIEVMQEPSYTGSSAAPASRSGRRCSGSGNPR